MSRGQGPAETTGGPHATNAILHQFVRSRTDMAWGIVNRTIIVRDLRLSTRKLRDPTSKG